MALDFQNVFACIGIGGRHPEGEHLVEEFAAWSMSIAEGCVAGGKLDGPPPGIQQESRPGGSGGG